MRANLLNYVEITFRLLFSGHTDMTEKKLFMFAFDGSAADFRNFLSSR